MGHRTKRQAARAASAHRQAQAQNSPTPSAESDSPKSTWENFVAFVQNAIQKLSFITELFSNICNYFTGRSNTDTEGSKPSTPASSASFGGTKASPRATSENADTAAPANRAANIFTFLRELFTGKAETSAPSAK